MRSKVNHLYGKALSEVKGQSFLCEVTWSIIIMTSFYVVLIKILPCNSHATTYMI